MKRVAVFIIFCVLLSSSAGATDPDTWNGWLFAGEALAGFGLGSGLMFGLYAAQSDEDEASPWLPLSGWVAGNAGGVILVGELFDARSRNWYVTYPVTLVGATIVPLVAIGIAAIALEVHGQTAFEETLLVSLAVVIGTPLATAFTYNLVKDPVDETWTVRGDVDVQPYAGLLADIGDGYVPVYGLSASF